MKKAIFLDRDGVINKMVWQPSGIFDSPQSVEQVRLVEGIVEVIAWANKSGILVVEVSNRPDVALGKMDWGKLQTIEDRIHSLLKAEGVWIDEILHCFHHPRSQIESLKILCECRKPKPGLLIKAAEKMNINLGESVMVGDNTTDMEAGKAVGCQTVMLFHEQDLVEKVNAKRDYSAHIKIYSHQQLIPILQKLLIF